MKKQNETPSMKPKKERPYKGKYLSNLSKEEQTRLQKRKTVFIFTATLLYAVYLFLPLEGNKVASKNAFLLGVYLVLTVGLIVATVVVSYNNFKKYRVRDEVDFYDAPKKGFNFFTFAGFELFTLLQIGLLVYTIGVTTLSFGLWGVAGMLLNAASVTLAVLARHVMVYAFGSTTFLPPPDALPTEGEQQSAPPQEAAAAQTDGQQEGNSADGAGEPQEGALDKQTEKAQDKADKRKKAKKG